MWSKTFFVNSKSCFLQLFYCFYFNVTIDIAPPHLYGINFICAGLKKNLKFDFKNPLVSYPYVHYVHVHL